jgi:hypothetical protein
MQLSEMHTRCGQCGFNYSRIDCEAWGRFSSRRIMCPICGWTVYEEHRWDEDDSSVLIKRNEAQGFGAYRLIPPGGYTGYNAFHSEPPQEVLNNIKDLLTDKGWKGYLSLWDSKEKKALLITGHPLNKFDAAGMNGTR